MTRAIRKVALVVALAALPAAFAQSASGQAAPAVPKARPKVKGRAHKVHLDSSPQQAAIYWDMAGPAAAPRDYGIAGYTPNDVKLPRGLVKVIIELRGFKTLERDIDIQKSQTLTFTLEKATLPGKLDLRAPDRSAEGADVVVDGIPKGTVPVVVELAAGRHQLEVRKNGYTTLTDWVELKEDENRTRDVSLQRAEAPAGTLLVTADVQGAEVWIDGARRDVAPASIAGVPAGDHVVEVKKEGAQPWRQVVTVVSGQQSKVNATIAASLPPPTAAPGAIRVVVEGADVWFDGEAKGKSPIELKGILPGAHIVELRKPGYKARKETVKVTPGEQLLVSPDLELAPADRPKGILEVRAAEKDAEVFLDGASLGTAPVNRTDLAPGKHLVLVRKPGSVDFKREVDLVEGTPVVVLAEMKAVGTLRFLSTPEGATVFIDGEPIAGKTPNQREEVTAGDHIVEVRLAGYYPWKQTVKVEGAKERIVSADLQVIPTGPTPEQVSHRKGAASSFGARTVGRGDFTADLAAGFPYFFLGRLTVGAYESRAVSVDAGVEARTFFQSTEFDVHGRAKLLDLSPLSAGVRADIGGGGGPGGRNTFFMDAGAVASLTFNDIVTWSANFRINYWTDQLCPTQADLDRGTVPREICKEDIDTRTGKPFWQAHFDKDPRDNRFGHTRFYLGTSLEISLGRRMSIFGNFEFVPFYQPMRKAFLDEYNSVQLTQDPLVYGNGGITFKF